MYSKKLLFSAVVSIILIILVAFYVNSNNTLVVQETTRDTSKVLSLDVYKSPSCGCCKKWIEHIHENDIESTVHNFQNFTSIKERKGVKPMYRSCHTSISKDGYVFEGHIPAKFIKKFMKENHASNVIGLSVPSMPIGSPGMEVEDRFSPYNVLILFNDGTSSVYANIDSYKEQF